MARRGSKPKTQEQHKIAGTIRPDRHGGIEPNPGGAIPAEPPEHLSDVAKEWWQRHAPLVNKMRIGRGADLTTFEAAATLYARARQCDDIIAEEGLTFIHPRTNAPTKRPEVTESRQSWHEYRIIAETFGLNPSGRARYKLDDSTEDKDAEVFFGTG